MPIFGNAAARVNFNNVLDQILKFAQESSLEDQKRQGELSLADFNQKGYMNLEGARSKAAQDLSTQNYGQDLLKAKQGADIKAKETYDTALMGLADKAPVTQLTGQILLGRAMNKDVSGLQSQLDDYNTSYFQLLAKQSSPDPNVPATPAMAKAASMMGAMASKDLIENAQRGNNDLLNIGLKKTDQSQKATELGIRQTEVNNKTNELSGTSAKDVLTHQGAILTDASKSLDAAGVAPYNPETDSGQSEAGLVAQVRNALNVGMGVTKSAKDTLTPFNSGLARELITKLRFRNARGLALTPEMENLVSSIQNRSKVNQQGIDAMAPNPLQPAPATPVTTPVAGSPPSPVVAQNTPPPVVTKPERQVLSDGSVMESYIAADGTKRWKRIL